MQVIYTENAEKDLQKIGHVAKTKIEDKVLEYAANPAAFRNKVKRLVGEDLLRLRVGDYRVLFTEDGIILNVIKVGHRREIYR